MGKKVQQIRTLSALWKYRSQLFSMFGAMMKGSYKASFMTMIALIAAALYILSPVDFIPDIFPVIGWVDDGAVFYFLLKRLMYELQRFEAARNPLKLIK